MTEATYNYSKLLGRIKELGMTQEQLSKVIGMNPGTLSLKLNNKGVFRQNDIQAICVALGIEFCEVNQYFFSH